MNLPRTMDAAYFMLKSVLLYQLYINIMIIEQTALLGHLNPSHIESSGDSMAVVQASEMQDLNELSDGSTSPDDIDSIHQRMKELLRAAVQSIEGERAEEAIQVLEKIERLIEYMAKLDKPFDKQVKVLCYYNLACIYQQQWVLDKCSTYLAKCLESMEIVCSEEGNTSIRRCTILVQTVLQYCAILSQAGDHVRALETAKLGIPLLKQIFNRSLDLCKTTSQTISNSKNSHQKILFSNQVLGTAREYLSDLVSLSSFNEMVDKESEDFEQTRQKIYFWKNNPQNNEKLMRKELGAFSAKDELTQQRNLLGLQNSDNWIETYNIGTIMHMKPLILDEYSDEDNFMFEMSKRKLLQKIMLSSVSYFSLATELRFIQIDRLKQNNQQFNSPTDKYVQCEDYKISEVFHLKAIEVICKFIKQNSVYVNHLVNSYHKHYRQNLLVIKEEASMIQYSFITDAKHKKKSVNSQKTQDENMKIRSEFTIGINQNIGKNQINEHGFKKTKGTNIVMSMKVLKMKEDSMKCEANEDSGRLRMAEDSTSRTAKNNCKADISGKFKNSSVGKKMQFKGVNIMTKEDMFSPRAKSKSKSKAEMKKSDKDKERLKKTIRINKTDKNILIEGDNVQDQKSDQQYNSITNKNMQFLSKATKSSQGFSMTKKVFKKQKVITKIESMEQLQHVNISDNFRK